MSRPTSTFPPGTSLHQPSNHNAPQQQSPVLAARVVSKRAELENLIQLRDLSNALATKMQALEDRISTLKDGTEAVACVLSNWGNVLQAISMASTKTASLNALFSSEDKRTDSLPVTLVRIPAAEQL